MSRTKQAVAPATLPIDPSAFEPSDCTTLRWLGNAGLLINARGVLIMADPLLEGFDMPLLIQMPIRAADVPRLDAMLVTHADGDHFSRETCEALCGRCGAFHSTRYVASLMRETGLPCAGHGAGDRFAVGSVQVEVTPADHAWQNDLGGYDRVFLPEDACGFYLRTQDGAIWLPGDSRLMPEHLQMPKPDVILFDFSNDSWHIGLEGALKLAGAYPEALLLLSHWGTVDAPDMAPFNADPKDLYARVVNPGRVRLLAPGEPLTLARR